MSSIYGGIYATINASVLCKANEGWLGSVFSVDAQSRKTRPHYFFAKSWVPWAAAIDDSDAGLLCSGDAQHFEKSRYQVEGGLF